MAVAALNISNSYNSLTKYHVHFVIDGNKRYVLRQTDEKKSQI